MRVVVLGATGCVGTRAVQALRGLAGIEVVATSRSGRDGSTPLEILDPASERFFEDGDLVIDFADSLAAPPDALIDRALASRILWVETSADAGLLERLYTRHRGRQANGTLVLGAGLFPGVSNLLAHEVAGGGCETIEVAIRYRPLSRAGAGVCAPMVDALSRPAIRYAGSKRVEDAPVSLGPGVSMALEIEKNCRELPAGVHVADELVGLRSIEPAMARLGSPIRRAPASSPSAPGPAHEASGST